MHRAVLILVLLLVPLAEGAEEPAQTNAVFVVPFSAAPGSEGADIFAGVALQNLVENMLLADYHLIENWAAWRNSELFPNREDLAAYLRGLAPEPGSIGKLPFRWIVRGHLTARDRMSLDVEDRRSHKRLQREISLDFPVLVSFRDSVLAALSECGIKGNRGARKRMLWQEDLPHPALAIVGRAYSKYIYQTYDETGFREALKLGPNSYVTMENLAYVLMREEKHDDAVKMFHQALEANPNGIDSLEGLVEEAARSDKLNDALDASSIKTKVRHLSSNSPEMLVALADSFAKYKHWVNAVVLDQKALATARKTADKSKEATILDDIARIYENQGSTAQSLQAFEQALKIQLAAKDRKGEARTLYLMGSLYQMEKQTKKAIDFYEQALAIQREIDARDPAATTLLWLGFEYQVSNQKKKAAESY